MGQALGSFCSRRRNTIDNAIILTSDDEFINDNSAWELIPPAAQVVLQQAAVNAPPTTIQRVNRIRRAVRQVVKLLQLRKLWSRLGNWLNATANSRAYRANGPLFHRRQRLQTVWSQLGTYIRPFAPLFGHLRRNRGRLEYV